jgi:putative transposase
MQSPMSMGRDRKPLAAALKPICQAATAEAAALEAFTQNE